MKKLIIIVMLLAIVGCNEVNKTQSVFKPNPQQWAAQYGDSEDSRLAYNLIILARATDELNRRVTEIESKAIMDGDLISNATFFGGPKVIYKVDPNNPNK